MNVLPPHQHRGENKKLDAAVILLRSKPIKNQNKAIKNICKLLEYVIAIRDQ